MRYFSMFSGIGGFELGIQRAYDNKLQSKKSEERLQDEMRNRNPDSSEGLSMSSDNPPLCVGYSEIDKYAIQIYEKHFGGHKNYGDATKIDPEQLPDFDFLVGGFPCQAFSIAGKRKGFEDTRGTLFFEIARILKRKQPRMFLIENVKGLLNHDGGNTFTTILQTIDELGYDAEWQVLNSKHFGVPQNRERVFIIGHLRGQSSRQIFPLGHNGKEINGEIKSESVQIGEETRKYENDNRKDTNSKNNSILSGIVSRNDCNKGISGTLTAGGNSGGLHSDMVGIGTLRTHKDGQGFREIQDRVSPCIPARAREDGSGQPCIAIPVLTPDRFEKRQNGRRFKDNGEPMFTINTQDKHGVYDGCKIRRLTPIECERLQGFPDGWTEEGTQGKISDTQRYKCLGNAVTTNVIQAIIEEIISSDKNAK